MHEKKKLNIKDHYRFQISHGVSDNFKRRHNAGNLHKTHSTKPILTGGKKKKDNTAILRQKY